MPFVSGKEIGNIDFLVPKLSIQTNIASMLSAFDEKIELIRQINQTLEAMAQAIYKEWLVNFNFPGATGEMQDSEFGPIPRGWRVAPIKDLVEILSGFAFKGGSFIEDGRYKIITIKNVQDGIFDSAKTSRIDVIPDRMPEYCKLKEGDILLSLTGNVGRVCFVYGQDMLLNQRVAKLLPKDQSHFGYMYTYFRSDPIKNDLISLGKGTAQQNLSPIETQNKLMIIPSRDMLLKFGGIVNPLYEMFIRNLVESRYLIEARDHLLPKFMNGEIEV
jgi:type I restriction enzyme S subunit